MVLSAVSGATAVSAPAGASRTPGATRRDPLLGVAPIGLHPPPVMGQVGELTQQCQLP
jgi:hypothetical protein